MVEQPTSTDEQSPQGDAPSTENVPPKRLPWVWTILLLLILPAVAAGLWYGGTRHRVDDHPKKVKQRPRRLVPKHRQPMARPVARPMARPAARPMAPNGAVK